VQEEKEKSALRKPAKGGKKEQGEKTWNPKSGQAAKGTPSMTKTTWKFTRPGQGRKRNGCLSNKRQRPFIPIRNEVRPHSISSTCGFKLERKRRLKSILK